LPLLPGLRLALALELVVLSPGRGPLLPSPWLVCRVLAVTCL
jgi:hypothetical protein